MGSVKLKTDSIQIVFHTYVRRYCNTVISNVVALKHSLVQCGKAFQFSGLSLRPVGSTAVKKKNKRGYSSLSQVSKCPEAIQQTYIIIFIIPYS